MASNGGEKPLQYYFQKQYSSCGHTINEFGSLATLDEQYNAGKTPRAFKKGLCADCRARHGHQYPNLDSHISTLRDAINGYVAKLDNASGDAADMQYVLEEKDTEIQQLRQQVEKLSCDYADVSSKYNHQSSEVGNLRKQVRELSQPSPQFQTEKTKKLQGIAVTGYINPIAAGFSTLKSSLDDHRWDPFIRSLFTELQEAVRRNNYEEICEIHGRMQSFAEAFGNDLKEQVEKAEREVVRQCEEGVRRLLGLLS
jgi:archaellum component FlaC